MHAASLSLETLLKTSHLHSYIIPRYQREYRWKKDKWEYLYDDISENSRGYFIGALIFIKKTQSDHGLQEYDVVDGQQRLTTISIAIAATYRLTRELIDFCDSENKKIEKKLSDFQKKIQGHAVAIENAGVTPEISDKKKASLEKNKNLKKSLETKKQASEKELAACRKIYQAFLGIKQPMEDMLLINDHSFQIVDRPRLTLSMQKSDHSNYIEVLNHCGVYNPDAPASKLPKISGSWAKSNIGKCYQFFYNKLRLLKKDSATDIAKFYQLISALTVIDIKATTTSDAYVLFESLNNRGEPLTGVDLIKNQILARIDEISEDRSSGEHMSGEMASAKWTGFLNAIPDATSQEKFLRHLYLAFKKEKPEFYVDGKDKVTAAAMVGQVFPSLIQRNSIALINHISDNAPHYGAIVEPKGITHTKLRRALIDIRNIEAVPSRILILSLFAKFRDIQDDLIIDAMDLISKFFIRRHLTDEPNTRKLDDIFVFATEALCSFTENSPKRSVIGTICNILKAELSPISDVKIPLHEDLGENSGFARAILTRIEVHSRAPDDIPDLWSFDANGKSEFTLEHILPQGDLDSSNWWINHLSPLSLDNAKVIQQDFCQKLGNLTLTSFNPELSNNAFSEKRDCMKSGKQIGYRNGLSINTFPAQQNDWKPSQITDRTELLIEALIPTLLFPDEELPNQISSGGSEGPNTTDQ